MQLVACCLTCGECESQERDSLGPESADRQCNYVLCVRN